MLEQNNSSKRPIDDGMLEKAKRAQSARKFAGLTREEMNIRHDIPPSTLRGWECPGTLKNQGLTFKGAQRLAKALLKEGVVCSVEWLLEGKGLGPHFVSSKDNPAERKKSHSVWEHQIALQKEIAFFEENNPNAVVLMIVDNGLEPYYSIGEYVGGIKRFAKEINSLENCFCIVETTENDIFIRKLIIEKKPNQFSIICINPNTSAQEPIKNDIKLNWAAPIIWHRKPDVK